MSLHSTDLILRAQRTERATHARQMMVAQDITDPENSKYEYACGDCAARGHSLRLKFVKAAERRVTFEQWDRKTGEVIANSSREKKYRLPAHFDRWPGANEHRCDQPVRYAALRQYGMRVNARQVEADQLIFQMVLPGHRLKGNEEAQRNDLRRLVRPVGLGLAGMIYAKHFVRLFNFFQKDPGLQNMQFFHDGLSLRTINETYFETAARLYDFLRLKNAVGRENAQVVVYLLNPNTSQEALNDPDTRGGFIDRSMPRHESGGKLKLFARGMNGDSIAMLREVALRNNRYIDAPTLVYGEAYLPKENPRHVEVEIFNPSQAVAYDEPFLLHPAKKLLNTRVMTAAAQASFGL